MITLVACLDMNFGIGDGDGNLLFSLPRDMKHFRSVTSGKIVVMGRKTWDSLPKKPLEKRKNYVVTMDESFDPVGAKVLHSIDEVLELGRKHDIYVVGGGEIYYQLIDDADRLIITHVHTISNKARVHFPDFDAKEWRMVGEPVKNEADENHPYSFSFATYERKND
ncbi:dihydrofolate reductase [Bacillus sonorensis]|uniref:dihydrofolate reductase n=1 Tax=Bacillus sonorensis TaxID=119858 RepID=UPI001B29FE18|nr:dihydrofolate reductase [Bacillus sonorensis]GIN66312.1 dihydrofolate reductase [Bacillus sonorensis]